MNLYYQHLLRRAAIIAFLLLPEKKIIKKQWLEASLHGDLLFSWDVFSYIFQ